MKYARLYVPILLLLSACMPPINSTQIMPSSVLYEQIKINPRLKDTIEVRHVVVPDGTGGYSAAVTKEHYGEALKMALLTSGLASKGKGNGKYYLDATILDVDQPFALFSITVISVIDYKLVDKATTRTIYEETITMPHTVGATESFDGSQRLRMATAMSLRENITHLIKVLTMKKIV